jgi:two-component system, NarL family, nitrate/nitrite response regulator NarL
MKNIPIRLLIVDDHPILRDSLVNLFAVYSLRIQVVGQAGNVQQAFILAEQNLPDLVLTDLQMNPLSGIDLIKALRQRKPSIRYVVFTALTDAESMLQAFDAGAEGFVTKDADARELVKAIELVAMGSTCYPSALKIAIEQRQQGPVATPREREVLALVAEGLTSKEIARRLLIDSRTVDVHRANIRQRFGLDSGAALLRFAVEMNGTSKN